MSDKINPATDYTGPADFNQQAPEQGDGSEIYQLVLIDVCTRSQFGARKYGHALHTTANVDYLVNAYQETLDLLIYLRGEIEKRNTVTAGPDESTTNVNRNGGIMRTCCPTVKGSRHHLRCEVAGELANSKRAIRDNPQA